jgi:hypothetical protein
MGIRKNELRIGNWVRWDYEESSEGNVYPVEYGYELDDIKNNPNIVKPIPLSEEWLLKFGFKEKSKWTFVLNTPNGRMLTYHLGTKIIHYGSNGYGSGEINCEYVHQLQNLYFALTGEELTIKTIDQ